MTVEEGAQIHYSIIMPGAVIKKNAVVKYAIIGENAVLEEGCAVGRAPEEEKSDNWGVAVVGPELTVGKGARVSPKEMLDHDLPEVKKNA